MAHSLGCIEVVDEGIEGRRDNHRLKSQGCDMLQELLALQKLKAAHVSSTWLEASRQKSAQLITITCNSACFWKLHPSD
jgi:EAL domain-containing protein (putative c-di-GMP-specific phosphodiesterase class I)